MFNLSFSEILVIIIIGVLVVGPEELPGLIRKIRHFMTHIRNMVSQITDQIDEQTDLGTLKKEAENINHNIQTIVDLEGKKQDAYDVKEVMADLHHYNDKDHQESDLNNANTATSKSDKNKLNK